MLLLLVAPLGDHSVNNHVRVRVVLIHPRLPRGPRVVGVRAQETVQKTEDPVVLKALRTRHMGMVEVVKVVRGENDGKLEARVLEGGDYGARESRGEPQHDVGVAEERPDEEDEIAEAELERVRCNGGHGEGRHEDVVHRMDLGVEEIRVEEGVTAKEQELRYDDGVDDLHERDVDPVELLAEGPRCEAGEEFIEACKQEEQHDVVEQRQQRCLAVLVFCGTAIGLHAKLRQHGRTRPVEVCPKCAHPPEGNGERQPVPHNEKLPVREVSLEVSPDVLQEGTQGLSVRRDHKHSDQRQDRGKECMLHLSAPRLRLCVPHLRHPLSVGRGAIKNPLDLGLPGLLLHLGRLYQGYGSDGKSDQHEERETNLNRSGVLRHFLPVRRLQPQYEENAEHSGSQRPHCPLPIRGGLARLPAVHSVCRARMRLSFLGSKKYRN
eukprot:Hpha_TRINITY_DN78_c0_g1::TRINITY_DN78_c0_g1_i1::g.110049::m.110049